MTGFIVLLPSSCERPAGTRVGRHQRACIARLRTGRLCGPRGQAALERKRIVLTRAPHDYIQITSALGEAPPHAIVVVPIAQRLIELQGWRDTYTTMGIVTLALLPFLLLSAKFPQPGRVVLVLVIEPPALSLSEALDRLGP